MIRRHAPWIFAAGFVALAACTTENGGDRPVEAQRVRPAVVERSAPAKRLSRAECEALMTRAYARQRAFDEAHLACTGDADCGYPRSCSCMPGCPVQIAKSAFAERDALIAQLEVDACAPWSAGGCEETAPMPVPSCVMPGPKCEAGRCVSGKP